MTQSGDWRQLKRDYKQWKREQRRQRRAERRACRSASPIALSQMFVGAARPFALGVPDDWRARARALWRSTAFRMLLGYLVVFFLFSVMQYGWLRWSTEQAVKEQVEQTIETDVVGLAEQYRRGGARRLGEIINERIRRDSLSLYLLVTPGGETVTGNMTDLASSVLKTDGLRESGYRRATDDRGERRTGLMRTFTTDSGLKLVVGHDLNDLERVRAAFRRSARLSISLTILLGLIGAALVTHRVLWRVDAMTAKADRIMAGDLSERLPVSAREDELDRLASSVNAMLTRIEALMAGLKQVSDNVAHDLKTPLTRLRNRADEALRLASGDEAHKAALEKVIEESDGLIRVFNALLLIARAEAGRLPQALEPIDLGRIARDVGELYEVPVEDAGGTLEVVALDSAPINGNRELIAQAIGNLIDNAMKYGRRGEAPPQITLSVSSEAASFAVAVADRGPGVPEEDRIRVLDRFVRLEKSRSSPGFGIGLSLATAVVKLHGGTIRLEDNAPGLKVVMTFPRQ